jgi:predicted nucleic acid-binding protein
VILIDTDVLIDLALDRDPHAGPASELFDYLEVRRRRAFVAWHSLSNFYYLVSPSRGKSTTRGFLVDLTRFVTVAPSDTDSLRFAAELPMDDFEDALQVAAAHACGAAFIATRNTDDYRRSPIPALSPKALLEELEGQKARPARFAPVPLGPRPPPAPRPSRQRRRVR